MEDDFGSDIKLKVEPQDDSDEEKKEHVAVVEGEAEEEEVTHYKVVVIGPKGAGQRKFMSSCIRSVYSSRYDNDRAAAASLYTTVQQYKDGEEWPFEIILDDGVEKKREIPVCFIEVNPDLQSEEERNEIILGSDLFIFLCDYGSNPDINFTALIPLIELVRNLKGERQKYCSSIIIGDSSNASLFSGNSPYRQAQNKASWLTRQGFEMTATWDHFGLVSSVFLPKLISRGMLKEKMEHGGLDDDSAMDLCLSGEVTVIYDILAIMISVADISTDVWVLYQWYSLSRMAPFYISLSILCAAQLAYITAFVIAFTSDSDNWGCCERVTLTLFLLPVSPLISFVFYFASDSEGRLFKWMQRMGFDMSDPMPDRTDMSKIEIFIQEKLAKHMGFLLEAGVEAFPQSILQMSVMVWYSEANWVSVASILLSLISVCSKSLVFSSALELRTFFFNYLSIVLDFFSMFALISWIFYHDSDSEGGDGSSLSIYAWFYILKVVTVTMPIVAGVGLGIASVIWAEKFQSDRSEYNNTGRCILGCCTGIIGLVFWIAGVAFSTLMLELVCCSSLAYLFNSFFSNRLSTIYGQSILWGKVIDFLYEGSDWNDKLLRVCLVNDSFIEHQTDDVAKEYIQSNRQSLFSEVTWKSLRETVTTETWNENGTPWNQFKSEMKSDIKKMKERSSDIFLCHCHRVYLQFNTEYGPTDFAENLLVPLLSVPGWLIWIPLYILTRFINFSFVWFLLLLRVSEGSSIAPLQLGMASLLFVLQLAWFICLISVTRLNYLIWHIIPGLARVKVDCPDENAALNKMKRIKDLHNAYSMEPDRRKVVNELMGPDVGSVLLMYLPTLLHDMGEQDMTEKKEGPNEKTKKKMKK